MKKILLALIVLSFTMNTLAAQEMPCLLDDKDVADEVEIRKVIKDFVTGIDNQNGEQILKTFYERSSLFAFKPDGKGIVTLSAKQFAAAHQAKKFGGQVRELRVEDLSITDGLQSSANVTAFNKVVFYNYRLTFIKQGEKWLIVSMMQRSRPRITSGKKKTTGN